MKKQEMLWGMFLSIIFRHFWTEQSIAQALAETNSHITIEMIDKGTFINSV